MSARIAEAVIVRDWHNRQSELLSTMIQELNVINNRIEVQEVINTAVGKMTTTLSKLIPKKK